jgi:GAF domain-containing protein
MKKFNEIAAFGQKLMANTDMNEVLHLIADEAKKLVDAQRCSLFIVDKENELLWTKHSDGLERIVIGLDSGVVGDTYKKEQAQIVNNPYEDERFLPHIDKKSGFVTHNIITVPIYNSKREVMGILQLLNKKEGDFTTDDLEFLTFYANYISGSLELVMMHEEEDD